MSPFVSSAKTEQKLPSHLDMEVNTLAHIEACGYDRLILLPLYRNGWHGDVFPLLVRNYDYMRHDTQWVKPFKVFYLPRLVRSFLKVFYLLWWRRMFEP